jgi:hypothetical protein
LAKLNWKTNEICGSQDFTLALGQHCPPGSRIVIASANILNVIEIPAHSDYPEQTVSMNHHIARRWKAA